MTARLIDGHAIIAGCGIGGAATAIALAREGVRCQVVERASVFSSEGAGIQLGPNATRILRQWGVLDALSRTAVYPENVEIRDGRSGSRVATVPLGKTAEEHCGAPYIVMHRADLQRGLLEHARGFDNIMIRRRFVVTEVETEPNAVTVKAEDGATARGAMLVGADGVWSRIRQEIEPTARARFSGRTAWRALIATAALPELFREPKVGLWMAPGAHLVHYPVSGGDALNVVAILKGRTPEESWSTPGDRDEITRHFARWPEAVQALVAAAESWRKWPLVRMRPLKRWSEGNVTLLGDAAHPVLPFLAQGGALAIEDAQALAAALTGDAETVQDALKAYETARMPRARAVQTASRRMGRVYHLGGTFASARNLALRLRRPRGLLKRHDWLYRFGAGD